MRLLSLAAVCMPRLTCTQTNNSRIPQLVLVTCAEQLVLHHSLAMLCLQASQQLLEYILQSLTHPELGHVQPCSVGNTGTAAGALFLRSTLCSCISWHMLIASC